MIPSEPIGSLPRSAALVEALAGTRDDDPPLDPLYDAAIRDTVEPFEATGSPAITDGEPRKYPNFWTDPVSRLLGPAPNGYRDPCSVGHDRRIVRNASQRLGV